MSWKLSRQSVFVAHNRARDAGWHITVRWRSRRAESIWRAIRELGAERIGHGVKLSRSRVNGFLAQRIGVNPV